MYLIIPQSVHWVVIPNSLSLIVSVIFAHTLAFLTQCGSILLHLPTPYLRIGVVCLFVSLPAGLLMNLSV